MKQKKESNAGVLIAAGVLFYLLTQNKSDGDAQKKGEALPPLEFFKRLKPYAMALSKKIGVPYLFIMSQIALETAFGRSFLFYKYFNVGGIKARANQKFIEAMTYEYVKDRAKFTRREVSKDKFNAKTNLWLIRTPQKFAVYDNLPAGLVGYAGILQNAYFKKYTFKTNDAKKYAAMLQSGKPKYATDINYLPKINKLIDIAATV